MYTGQARDVRVPKPVHQHPRYKAGQGRRLLCGLHNAARRSRAHKPAGTCQLQQHRTTRRRSHPLCVSAGSASGFCDKGTDGLDRPASVSTARALPGVAGRCLARGLDRGSAALSRPSSRALQALGRVQRRPASPVLHVCARLNQDPPGGDRRRWRSAWLASALHERAWARRALGLRQAPARRRTPFALLQITAFWMQLVSMLSAAGAVVALWFIVPPAA